MRPVSFASRGVCTLVCYLCGKAVLVICRFCGDADMEREDTYVMHQASFQLRPKRTQPAALYYCQSCGAEYEWVRKQGLRVLFIPPAYEEESP